MDLHKYPIYKSENDETTIEKKGKIIDTKWIIPYNHYLSTKYDFHINVEACHLILESDYSYKYIHKSIDKITVNFCCN